MDSSEKIIAKDLQIALVVGRASHPRILDSFASLSKIARVVVFCFDVPDFTSAIPKEFEIMIYPNSEDISGYMPNLEEALQGFDKIFSFETWQFSSMQAAKAACDYGIELTVYSTNDKAKYFDECPNICLVQNQLDHSAGSFLAPTQSIKDALLSRNIPESKIQILKPVFSPIPLEEIKKRRNKFRSYFKLNADDFIALYVGPLEKSAQLHHLLGALSQINEKSPRASSVKVILAGNGAASDSLKKLAIDLKIGGQVFFIHQSLTPFDSDLFAASDLLCLPVSHEKQYPPSFPFYILKALGLGCMPLVHSSSLANELLLRQGLCFEDDSEISLCNKILAQINNEAKLSEQKSNLVAKLNAYYKTFDSTRNALILGNYNDIKIDVGIAEEDLILYLAQLCEGSHAGKNDEHLQKLSVQDSFGKLQKSLILWALAESCRRQERFDVAEQYIDQALILNPQNYRALITRGFVCWSNHLNEESLANFKMALGTCPNEALATFGVGLVYKRVGMIEDSLYWMERSIALGLSTELAKKSIALTASQCASSEHGLSVLERCVEQIGRDPHLMRAIGALMIKCGDERQGYQILDQYLPKQSSAV